MSNLVVIDANTLISQLVAGGVHFGKVVGALAAATHHNQTGIRPAERTRVPYFRVEHRDGRFVHACNGIETSLPGTPAEEKQGIREAFESFLNDPRGATA